MVGSLDGELSVTPRLSCHLTECRLGMAPPSSVAQMPGAGCFTQRHRRALEKARHSTFPSAVSCWSGLGHCHCRQRMETLIRKMGGSWWGHFKRNGLAFTPSSLPGRLSSPSRGFYRKGLNRCLPRQTNQRQEQSLSLKILSTVMLMLFSVAPMPSRGTNQSSREGKALARALLKGRLCYLTIPSENSDLIQDT